MLNVQSTDNVDTRSDQLFHVLIALGILTARRVGMGEFIHQANSGTPSQHGIQIHLIQRNALIFDLAASDLFEPFRQGGGLGPSMRFDEPHYHIDALSFQPVCFL